MAFLTDVLPKISERQFAAQVDKLARLFGYRVWRDNATNAPRACPKCHAEIHLPRNTSGWPDRVYVRGNRLIFLELKSDRGRLSDDQADWLTALMGVTKVVTLVVRPKDWKRIEDLLR